MNKGDWWCCKADYGKHERDCLNFDNLLRPKPMNDHKVELIETLENKIVELLTERQAIFDAAKSYKSLIEGPDPEIVDATISFTKTVFGILGIK